MGARLWYRSCPAVSQISNFTVVSSKHTDWAKNAAERGKSNRSTGSSWSFQHLPAQHRTPSPPMVVSWNSSNCPLTKRSTKLDLPTAMSPNSTSLNWQILVCGSVPLERLLAPLELIPTWKGDGWGNWASSLRWGANSDSRGLPNRWALQTVPWLWFCPGFIGRKQKVEFVVLSTVNATKGLFSGEFILNKD